MDEKYSNPLPQPATSESASRRPARGRYHLAAFGILATFFLLARNLHYWSFLTYSPVHHGCHGVSTERQISSEKVALEAHIMSKCPDARDCLQKLILPVMANVSDKVDFTLSYIGTLTNHDDGVECMHGQTECLGNIVELCAADVYPDPKSYLPFTNCLSQRYKDIPNESLLKDCTMEYGLDFDEINHCMSKDDGAYAMGLLRDSVQRSKDNGVKYSCTVRLEDKVRCIRDGGKWKDCEGGNEPEDLIKEIEELYKGSA